MVTWGEHAGVDILDIYGIHTDDTLNSCIPGLDVIRAGTSLYWDGTPPEVVILWRKELLGNKESGSQDLLPHQHSHLPISA